MKAPLKLFLLLFVAFLWNSSKAQDTLYAEFTEYWFEYSNYDNLNVFQFSEFKEDTSLYYVGSYDISELYLVDNRAISKDDYYNKVILYDFNLALGDTFYLKTPDSLYTYRLMHLDSIQIKNKRYARQYLKALNHDNNEIIIQGVGSIYGGIINYWNRYGGIYNKFTGLCFWNDDDEMDRALVVDNDSVKLGFCDDINLTDNINEVTEQVYLSPNPVSSILEVAGVRGDAIVVIDATGKMVLKEHDLNINSDAYQIDVGDLEPGLYYLKILNDSGVGYTGRFVKI